MEVGEREIIYLSRHCHHQNDSCHHQKDIMSKTEKVWQK